MTIHRTTLATLSALAVAALSSACIADIPSEAPTTTMAVETTTTTTLPQELSVSMSFTPTGTSNFCNVFAVASGLAPNTSYAVTFTVWSNQHSPEAFAYEATSGATGSINQRINSYFTGGNSFVNQATITIDGTLSEATRILCPVPA